MDPQLKAKWIEALRSGKYKQGKQYLRANNNTYCCLGVLADVAGLPWSAGPDGDCYTLVDHGRSHGSAMFSERQCEQLGLERQGTLMNMNDNGKSFSEIADYIETHL